MRCFSFKASMARSGMKQWNCHISAFPYIPFVPKTSLNPKSKLSMEIGSLIQVWLMFFKIQESATFQYAFYSVQFDFGILWRHWLPIMSYVCTDISLCLIPGMEFLDSWRTRILKPAELGFSQNGRGKSEPVITSTARLGTKFTIKIFYHPRRQYL